jgi:phosphoglucosamine mutase
MTGEMTMKLGRALGYRLFQQLGRRPKVLIGKDTRLSGYLFETALASGLVSVGADVQLVGPLPTPGIAFLTMGMRCDAGVVISASHNPYQDNGIKLFARNGFKLPDSEELALERLMLTAEIDAERATGPEVGRAYRIDDAAGRYSVFAKGAYPRNLTLDGMRVVIDCANGAGYRVAPEVLHELGADVIALGVNPDGVNINEGCGALHPEELGRAVVESGAHVGIALDGDADRCIMSDEEGRIVDGDQILTVLGRQMIKNGTLPGNTVVATVMSNLGLDRAIRDAGGHVVRVGVGDRHVVERMRKDGYTLGGEQSGHVILREHATTGDGLVTGLAMLGVMVSEGASLGELAGAMTRYPQAIENIDVTEKPPLADIESVQAAIRTVESELGDDGRVLVRYSGTQMLARVMVEGPEIGLVNAAAAGIAQKIRETVG